MIMLQPCKMQRSSSTVGDLVYEERPLKLGRPRVSGTLPTLHANHKAFVMFEVFVGPHMKYVYTVGKHIFRDERV